MQHDALERLRISASAELNAGAHVDAAVYTFLRAIQAQGGTVDDAKALVRRSLEDTIDRTLDTDGELDLSALTLVSTRTACYRCAGNPEGGCRDCGVKS